jgi:hypothetical protein
MNIYTTKNNKLLHYNLQGHISTHPYNSPNGGPNTNINGIAIKNRSFMKKFTQFE